MKLAISTIVLCGLFAGVLTTPLSQHRGISTRAHELAVSPSSPVVSGTDIVGIKRAPEDPEDNGLLAAVVYSTLRGLLHRVDEELVKAGTDKFNSVLEKAQSEYYANFHFLNIAKSIEITCGVLHKTIREHCNDRDAKFTAADVHSIAQIVFKIINKIVCALIKSIERLGADCFTEATLDALGTAISNLIRTIKKFHVNVPPVLMNMINSSPVAQDLVTVFGQRGVDLE